MVCIIWYDFFVIWYALRKMHNTWIDNTSIFSHFKHQFISFVVLNLWQKMITEMYEWFMWPNHTRLEILSLSLNKVLSHRVQCGNNWSTTDKKN